MSPNRFGTMGNTGLKVFNKTKRAGRAAKSVNREGTRRGEDHPPEKTDKYPFRSAVNFFKNGQ